MKTFKTFFSPHKAATFILYFSILVFIIAFNFSDNPKSGWYQQFLPYLNNAPLSDVIFVDSLTGYGITGDGTVNSDTNYIIKTTNGGDNWNIIQTLYTDLTKVKFLDANTGFVCGGSFGLRGKLYKTTNGGKNWDLINTPFGKHFDDMCMFNEDTIWITDDIGLGGGIFRTNNGGLNWVVLYSDLGIGPRNIYMFNNQIGFFENDFNLFKTTNGGFNWTFLNGQNGFSDIYFIDTLIGWKCLDSMRKSINGGSTWVKQNLPPQGFPVLQNGYILTSVIGDFFNLNKDTIWGVGSDAFFGFGQHRGLIYISTNSGFNWGFQLPDTSIRIGAYYNCIFTNKLNGWCYSNTPTGVHTLTGGDTTFYTNIYNQTSIIPEYFQLYQNYPNPFNPSTTISYELKISANVILKIFNLQGKEILTLLNKKQNPGFYNVEFVGNNISSGIYFFRLQSEDGKGNIYSETKKMMLIR